MLGSLLKIKYIDHWKNPIKLFYDSRRYRKYIPMYTEIVKRKRRGVNTKKKVAEVNTSEAIEETVESTPDVLIAHPTTALQALGVLKGIEQSISNLAGIVQVYLRVWVKVDIRRIALRGNVVLPHAVGPKAKVLAICEPEEVTLALENGATYAGGDNLLERIANGWTNFDVCLCTSIQMPKLVKVARILGPKKLMPNLKSGTLTSNLMESIRKLSSSECVQYRGEPITIDEYNMLKLNSKRINALNNISNASVNYTENDVAVLQVPIGTINDNIQQIITNTKHFIIELIRNRPTNIIQKKNIQFQWPPPRRDVNSILDNNFSAIALGLVSQNNVIAQPIFIHDLMF